ncbi:MFS general substrate transporter [Epithele typhae]|uniref:MFS general substrate transporter n=1 Tax=Epithele typhae TaxID=378194 RepID=UPI002007DFA0|nr:MFS general substrate transporter [Epithele typhae]KAH9936843.1 MFS general substrate transporter [Epithele typhae]
MLHGGHATHPPPLLSTARVTSFATCILVALASGTNYVSYGPQLGARLELTHTQINLVGLAGNIGVYGSAPLLGGIVDRKGPRIMMVLAFCALLTGYLGIRHFYDSGLPEGATTLSSLSLAALIAFAFCTGVGGNGGLVSSMNATAKSWPDSARATANGIVISGFGLSAFLFSTIAHTLFPGNTSEFLLVLAVGTALPMILGFFFVRPIPPPHVHDGPPRASLEHGTLADTTDYGVVEGLVAGTPTAFDSANSSQTHLLAREEGEDDEDDGIVDEESGLLGGGDEDDLPAPAHRPGASEYVVPATADALMLSPTRSASQPRHRRSSSRRSARPGTDKTVDGMPNVYGKRLFMTVDFWLLFAICSLLSGTGIMYINNVGAISQALFANNNPDYDEVEASQWQAAQVSAVSVTNCLGRILIGIIADAVKARLRLPRTFCIVVVATMFIVSQAACLAIDNVADLWKASLLLGLSYGGLFGLFPTLVIEWFGLAHFSENWGFVSLSPMIGGNVFSIAFGRNLDAHADGPGPAPNATSVTSALSAITSHLSAVAGTSTAAAAAELGARAGGAPAAHHCVDGRACYVDSLRMTVGACCVALALGVYASWRDLRRQRLQAQWRGVGAGPTVVVWDGEED